MALENPSLFLASLVAFSAGSVYLVVASEFRNRIGRASATARRPLLFFALWWASLGVNIALGGAFYLAASFGYTDFPLQLVYAIIQRLLLAVALVGLMYYLLYLLTDRGWLAFLLPYYGAYFLLVVYLMYAGGPDGLQVGRWRVDLHYTQRAPGVLALVNLAMLVLPPVGAALTYFFRFFHRAKERLLRYRIAIVSWAITLWWIMAVFAGQREAIGNEEFQLVNRFTGLVTAILILAAYRPPSRIRRWLEGPADEAAPTA